MLSQQIFRCFVVDGSCYVCCHPHCGGIFYILKELRSVCFFSSRSRRAILNFCKVAQVLTSRAIWFLAALESLVPGRSTNFTPILQTSQRGTNIFTCLTRGQNWPPSCPELLASTYLWRDFLNSSGFEEQKENTNYLCVLFLCQPQTFRIPSWRGDGDGKVCRWAQGFTSSKEILQLFNLKWAK